MTSIRSAIVAATITTMMAAGIALAAQPLGAQPSGAQSVNTQPNPGPQQRFAYNSPEMPTTGSIHGGIAGRYKTPGMSSAEPQHEVSSNGPPTFTPWLNITNGQ